MRTLSHKASLETLKAVLEVLNDIYATNPAALHALCCNRVPCNEVLANHPLVQVEVNSVAQGETYSVGTLGIINALVEHLTGERVAISFSEPDSVTGRCRMLGFVKYQSPSKT